VSDANVLGQRTRKVNIDYGLADKLNAEVKEEERLRKLDKGKKKNPEKEEDIWKLWPPIEYPGDTGFITLEDITCIGADGKVIEHYDELRVRKSIACTHDDVRGTYDNNFTLEEGAEYFDKEDKGWFLPSMALTCNILAKLYKRKDDPAYHELLMQYRNIAGDSFEYNQNTLIHWDAEGIIHYPHNNDFTGGVKVNNKSLGLERKYLLFHANDSFKDTWLWHAVKDKEYLRFLQNLTGLQDPGILSEIGDYYQRPAHIYGPTSCSESANITSAYLGCDDRVFDITTMKRRKMYIRGVHAINYAPMM